MTPLLSIYYTISNLVKGDDKYYLSLMHISPDTLENAAKKIISSIHEQGMQVTEIYNSVIHRFYSLTKILKTSLSCRSTVSSINSPITKLSAFLSSILTQSYHTDK